MIRLAVFDLDGTISVNSEFYRKVYSGTLEKLIAERRGAEGLAMLKHCRENYDGRGELALFALNIAFKDWAELLINAPMDILTPKPKLCELVRSCSVIKVIYTGSPINMAVRILERLGFRPFEDFELIIGWQKPEQLPLKWTCSPLIFKKVLDRFSILPNEAWSVGDIWDTDLLPAQTVGMKTAIINKHAKDADLHFPLVEEFLQRLRKE